MTEYLSEYDSSCDYCGKQVGTSNLRAVQLSRSVSWLCDACHDRQEERYRAEVAAEESEEARWKEAAYR